MALEIAASHLENVAEQPVRAEPPADVRRTLLSQPLPEDGKSPEEILKFFEQYVLPHSRGNGHPGFMGWVMAPPAHMAVITEMPGAAMNTPCGGGNQSATYLEWNTIRWIKELLGYNAAGSHGIFVSGGSMANLTGIAAARHAAAQRAGWDMRRDGMRGAPDFRIYASSEVHLCVTKAAELMGLGRGAIVTIGTDDRYRMNVAELGSVIERDLNEGATPFCVVGNAGTVSTGAVDDLAAISALCQRHNLWFHIDGAYGAFATVDPERADLFRGMENADSIALDPHKWLSVPFDCGCILARSGQALRDCFSLIPPVIRQVNVAEDDLGAPHEYSFQLSRAFRALKVWASLAHVGARAFRATVQRQNAMAAELSATVEQAKDLELMAPTVLTIVCFRYVPASFGADTERVNELNRKIVAALQDEGRVYPSSTELNGRFAIRANIFHYATDQRDVNELLTSVRRHGAELASAGG